MASRDGAASALAGDDGAALLQRGEAVGPADVQDSRTCGTEAGSGVSFYGLAIAVVADPVAGVALAAGQRFG